MTENQFRLLLHRAFPYPHQAHDRALALTIYRRDRYEGPSDEEIINMVKKCWN